ncbi:protein arginine methyltransferase NDUFAF7 homolog, mitochondrial [Culex quinquefasciatus]|uniref:protein arginine methyltransferase NDUFAF7 homolog, mitochondrial n=1 Tax=Culex quinquefasciatus TaxID=7176 RepID=UPI0018E2A576|nr:protein arginine methyltransferase NDUFAF7 homolog, mitochondrial [Culex quinquefasciatus]
MIMNLRASRVIFNQIRCYCYKPVRRVSLPPASKLAPKVAASVDNFSLKNEFKSRILATGPIPVAAYMKQVLTNPAAGYYMNEADVFGSKGDFVTSPEIGQIFGELVAAWCLNEWTKFGRPAPYQLIELGPGKGTMMRDVLRVFRRLGASDGLSVHLVEMSEHLSEVQAELLCRSSEECADKAYYRAGVTRAGTKVFWYRHLEDVPAGFSIVLAHEFFDALPIHKFQKQDNVWKEVLVDVDSDNKDKLRFVLSKAETPMLKLVLNNYPELVKDREHIEISLDSESIIRQIAQRFNATGGYALVVDYGHSGEKGDTFRAFKNHKLHDPLEEPGSADLTADVDFSLLNRFCENTGQIFTMGPIEQGSFLEMAGSKDRLEVLLANAKSEEEKHRLSDGYKMLTDRDQMGSRFKFFALFPKELESFFKSQSQAEG